MSDSDEKGATPIQDNEVELAMSGMLPNSSSEVVLDEKPAESKEEPDEEQHATHARLADQDGDGIISEQEQREAYTWDLCFVFEVGEENELVTVREPIPVDALEKEMEDDSDDDGVLGLFGRKKNKTFHDVEKTQKEHFKNTTADIVKRLEAAGLKTDMWYSVQKDEVYCRVGATEQRLMLEAARTMYDLELDDDMCLKHGLRLGVNLAKLTKAAEDEQQPMLKKLGFRKDVFLSNYGRYDYPDKGEADAWRQELYRRHPDMRRYNDLEDKLSKGTNKPKLQKQWEVEFEALRDEKERRPDSLFSSVDRLKLTMSIIEADEKLEGCGLSIQRNCIDSKHSMIAFFPLHEEKKLNALRLRWLQLQSAFNMPIKKVRNYFGEAIAIYFSFLEFYNLSLIAPALVGILFFVWQMLEDKVDVDGLPGYALYVALWATLFLEMWKRRESKMRILWGMTKFINKEQPRPEFEGEWRPSAIDGSIVEADMSFFEKVKRAFISQSVVWTLIGVVIAAVVGVFLFRNAVDNTEWGNIVTAVVNAIQIQVLNFVYGLTAVKLNDWENHRTDSAYENALIAKTFLFKFVNSYNTLFYIAFIKDKYENSTDSNGNEVNGCGSDTNCLTELQTQLGTVFISLIVINNTIEVLVPYLKNKKEERANRARSSIVNELEPSEPVYKEKSKPEKEYELTTYESTFDDFDEMVVQFGFVTLFVVVFPLAPLFALLNNIVETQIDATKLCKLTRRPEPRGIYNIGTWGAILEIVGIIAVLTNAAIIVFLTEQVKEWLGCDVTDPDCDTKKWKVFFVAEHVILLLKFGVAYFVPDEPEKFVEHRLRQDYLVDVLINGMEEEQVDLELLKNPGEIVASADDFEWDKRVANKMRASNITW